MHNNVSSMRRRLKPAVEAWEQYCASIWVEKAVRERAALGALLVLRRAAARRDEITVNAEVAEHPALAGHAAISLARYGINWQGERRGALGEASALLAACEGGHGDLALALCARMRERDDFSHSLVEDTALCAVWAAARRGLTEVVHTLRKLRQPSRGRARVRLGAKRRGSATHH